jgi:hypothetical protein
MKIDISMGAVVDGIVDLSWSVNCNDTSASRRPFAFEAVIDDICWLDWESIDADEMIRIAKAYYYFSIQFRENLEIACKLCPHDDKLVQLREGECDTDNLSPWPGVAAVGERLNHDEFVRRLLSLEGADGDDYLAAVGRAYLDRVRQLDDVTRATSIASYEDGGLSRVFAAMLRAPDWRGAGAGAFKFFLEEHIRFDTDDDGGHGTLSRHLKPDDRILPLWIAFRELLVAAVPTIRRARSVMPADVVAVAAE